MESERLRFGPFEFDPANRELRRAGALVRLQSQPAQVLACLVACNGEVVSRESLCKAVWGSETFVDFERGLNFCVAQIRSALDDDAASPRYVQTIPKRGYQFIALVERVPPAQGPPETVSSRRPFPAKAVALWCALIVCAVAGYAGYRKWLLRDAIPPTIAVVRFDNETGDPAMIRFSDGLTGSLVEQLTVLSGQHYGVIGNARILRLPRDQRDLQAIGGSLRARYVVLGQVQGSGSQIRILAHLIRLPDQTHLWVARIDQASAYSLTAELDVTRKIAAQFSRLVVKDSTGNPLPPFPSN
jgi:DNA-binding winged helix-turn-helix (wHTH) protein/TolB-like protein